MGTVHAKDASSQQTDSDVETSGGNRRETSSKEDYFYGGHEPAVEEKEIHVEGVKARVDKIFVDGLNRTKDDIVIDAVQELFKARDFQEVVVGAHQIRGRLESLGCFKHIGVFIDTSSGPNATPDGLEVTFHVRELNRIIASINTIVGNNEGSLKVGMRLPNLFGRGEKIQADYIHGSKKTVAFNVFFTKPLRGRLNPVFTSTVFQTGSQWPWSGYKEIERGLLLDLAFNSTPLLRHNLQWEGSWRDLSCMSRSASFQVREQTGPTLKSSLHHILTIDKRNTPIFPTSGYMLKLSQELAGLGGNIGFLKNQLTLQHNLTILPDIVLQATLSGGVLMPVNKNLSISICDKFFLGGPLTIRGFHMRGVGPHSDGNSLGGNIYWSGGLHLFTPLPFNPGKGGIGDLFRTHFFVNAGGLNDMELGEVNIELIKKTIRLAYGIGIALRIGQMGCIELNYCIPALYQRGDQTNPGVQFGVGVDFL